MEWICVLKPNATNQLSMYEDQKSSGHDKSRKNQPAGHPRLMSGNAILSWNLNQDLSCGRIHPDSSLLNTRPWLAASASWALNQVRQVLNSKGSLIHIHSFIHILSLSAPPLGSSNQEVLGSDLSCGPHQQHGGRTHHFAQVLLLSFTLPEL